MRSPLATALPLLLLPLVLLPPLLLLSLMLLPSATAIALLLLLSLMLLPPCYCYSPSTAFSLLLLLSLMLLPPCNCLLTGDTEPPWQIQAILRHDPFSQGGSHPASAPHHASAPHPASAPTPQRLTQLRHLALALSEQWSCSHFASGMWARCEAAGAGTGSRPGSFDLDPPPCGGAEGLPPAPHSSGTDAVQRVPSSFALLLRRSAWLESRGGWCGWCGWLGRF